MNKRLLVPMGLGLLLLVALASAQQDRAAAAPNESEVRVIAPKNHPVSELADLLRAVTGPEVKVVADEVSNRLIVYAPPARMEEVIRLIQELDVTREEMPQGQYLICRVYMLELPSKDQNLKPFSLLLETPAELPATQVLAAAKEANVQITTLLQRTEDDQHELVIEGRAASNDALQQVLAKMADSHIKQLKWDEEDFTAAVPAAQVSRLPAPLQDHIRKFLGDEVRAVGYWFGNLSIPGDLNAPIGPWRLDLKTQSGPGSDLVLEVRVTRESPLPFVNETQLFSNTVQGKAGRPIIIGYNRESYGTRVMGAMVILLEPDTTAPPIDQAKPR